MLIKPTERTLFYVVKHRKKLHSYHWKELPITNDAIDKVAEIAKEQKQPKIIKNQPIFEWNLGNPIVELGNFPTEATDTNEEQATAMEQN